MVDAGRVIALALLVVTAGSACATAPANRYGRSTRQDDEMVCRYGGVVMAETGY